MLATKKESEAMDECYKRLYDASIPKAKWCEIQGREDDFFLEYEIDEVLMMSIINNVLDEYKIKSRWRRRMFTASILLGASPKFTKLNN